MKIKEKTSRNLTIGGLIKSNEYPSCEEITDKDVAYFLGNLTITHGFFEYKDSRHPMWFAESNRDNFDIKSDGYLYIIIGKDKMLRIDANKDVITLTDINESMIFYHLIKR